MHKQTQPISCSVAPANQDSKKPSSMACEQVGADEPTGRSSGGAEHHLVPSAPADDFEFCILSSGGLAPAGDDAADMCVADEVFSGGKLLPLRLSSAASADASSAPLLLLRSDSLDGATTWTTTSSSSGFSSRSGSRSSSSCVSRSTSSSSASSSDHAAGPVSSSSSSKSACASSADAAVPLPPRRSQSGSGSVFYAHPSPSPRPPPRGRSRTAATPAAARRMSTGSAPPPSWGVIRLGVVGAPEVYAPRPAEYRKVSASRSARFEQQHRAADKKLALGLLGAGLVCSCSPDAVAPVGSAEVAAAEARRRRKKAEEKKRSASATAEQNGTKGSTARSRSRRSRILEWLEDLSISKEKSTVSSCR
ncbi:hypothetical protein BDA96_01G352600 [Sorghum bicolor]|uniref:Uncharacterized protein n=1 Tax=Sorghum bicolor TaxID=4558 RepID=A0A921S2V0_SORBI|nr:hypothetical protein BDA96_01G352600 [Sorghum bicolor]